MHRVVPELIVENYRVGRYSGEFPAVGMFLDLSGFSTMTDVLMQHGQHGAEVLAGLMHGVFDPLVESIFHYGGKIIGFAGDGIMALYPIEEDAESTALRALSSAYIVQQGLAEKPTRETPYGTFPISVKIGLTSGSVSWGILFSADGEDATYYFRGTAVDESAHAEHYASPGEILLSTAMARLLQEQIITAPQASYERFEGFRVALPDPTPISFPPVDLEISRHFMPEEVIVHDVRGEFRQIVNLFMSFPDLSHEELQELMAIVFKLRRKYGGLVSRLDFGDKGCNMLMLWGAPVAYENDIGRALNFMLALQSKVDFQITAGVTYYISHAGYLGSALCEDYTCYGWGVNLASRFMMNAAPGQIWVDDRIARRVSRRFEMEFIGSQRFKGFAERQKVHLLRGYKLEAEVVYQGELVGREEELTQLANFIEPLWHKHFAGLLLVVGEAGIGKGRLVHEFRLSELFGRNRALWAVCQSNQILRQSFNPLRSSLLRYFGVSPSHSPSERKQSFDSKLAELLAVTPDPELVRELDRTRSFLAALVEVSWPESLYEQLDAEGRYNNTFLALIALVKAESLRQPMVIFLEDLQFTDSDTKDLISRLIRAIRAAQKAYPVVLIVTARPQGASLDPDLIDARIELRGLSRAPLARLLETLLGGEVSPHLVDLVMGRSEGNPYFAEQIIRYMQDENRIEMSQAGWAVVGRMRDALVPGDIQAVLVARLDQLAREVREVVQTASVLGREFEIVVLAQMLHDEEGVLGCVGEAEKAAIWAPLNEMRYIFSHGLLRDAAYAMQMQARRRELHALALEALEHLYGGDLNKRYAELGYHAECALLREKAQLYYRLAGKVASDLYQNSHAIDYYTRALVFTSPEDLSTQYDLRAERVKLYNRLADRVSQLEDLDSLENLAQRLNDNTRLAKMLMGRAVYHYLMGSYADAIDDAAQAETLSDSMADSDLEILAQTTWFLALMRLGRLEEAMQRAQNTLRRVRQANNQRGEARVLNGMGMLALEQREPGAAQQYLVEALRIARSIKARGLEHRALNNLAMSEGDVHGDYAVAREYYQQAYNIAREIGDRNAEGVALGNLGFAAGMQGDLVAAQEYHQRSLAVARETGNRYHETYTLINLSAVTGIQNNAALALQFALEAAEIARRAGELSGEAWAMLYMGHAYTLMHEFEQARAAYRKSIEIRDALGQPSLSMEPRAGLVEVALKMEDPQSALPEAKRILDYLVRGGTLDGTDEPLRVYYSCYLFLKKQQDPHARQILQAAIQLLEAQVSKFKDEHARKMYIENVPWRLAIRQAKQNLTMD